MNIMEYHSFLDQFDSFGAKWSDVPVSDS